MWNRTILLLAVLSCVLTTCVALSGNDARPFIFSDEIPDADDAQTTHDIEKKCREIIKSLEDGLVRLWASYFTMKEPRIELPSGRHVSGLMKIEQYADHMEDFGISDYKMVVKSQVYVTDDGCVFERESTWKQHGCTFYQPAIQEIKLRESETPGMGIEMHRWIEHWNVNHLSSQYEDCAEAGKMKMGEKDEIKGREEREVEEIPTEEVEEGKELPPEVQEGGKWQRQNADGPMDIEGDEGFVHSVDDDDYDDSDLDGPDLHFEL